MAGTNIMHTPAEANPRRALILRHAIATFAHGGFRNTDVQVIADRAGVGKGTVYRHFGSKEELFWAATYDVLTRLDRCMFSAVEGVEDPLEALHALSRACHIFRAEFRVPGDFCAASCGVSRHGTGPAQGVA